jgi:hypothetical protein
MAAVVRALASQDGRTGALPPGIVMDVVGHGAVLVFQGGWVQAMPF